MQSSLDEKKAQTAIVQAGVGPRVRLSESDQFERACLTWLRGWVAAYGKLSQAGICLFSFPHGGRVDSALTGGLHQPAFKAALPKDIGGHAFACTILLDRVFRADLPATCKEIPDLCRWIDTQDFGDLTLLAFDPRQAVAVVLDSDDWDTSIRITLDQASSASFKLSDLDTLLERFYKEAVYTHRGGCPVWRDHDKRQLCEEPEKRVQKSLYLTLMAAIEFHNQGTIRMEVDNAYGREDVEITVLRDGKYELGIIELKVLFPNKSLRWNRDWALKSVQQVVDYCSTRSDVVEKLACCYDGRKIDQAMPEFFAEANAKGIKGRRYFMETPNVKRAIKGYTT